MDDERNFNPVTPAAKDDIRPEFLSNGAADDLRNAEKAAAEQDTSAGGLYNAQKNENEVKGLYNGEGVNNRVGRMASAAKEARKGNFRGAFKKGGPILGIFFVIFGVGALMAGTQVFQPFALVAQIQDSFNSMHTSAYNRSARFIRYQMDSGRLKDPVKAPLFGKAKFVLSEKQKAEYERHGITYNEDFEGKRVLEYETDGGQKRVVAATKADAEALRAAGHNNVLSIDAAYNDSTFSQKFTAASQTWRGQFANWFGTRTNDVLSKNKMTRNLWKDYKDKAAEADASGKSRLDLIKEMISNKVNASEGGGVRRIDEGEDSNKDPTYSEDNEGNSKVAGDNVRSKLDSIKSKISGGVNVGCAVADFAAAVNLMVSAKEAAQIIQITTSYMEAVDKTKAGYGDEAPINEIAETLNTQAKIDHEVIVPGGGNTISDSNGSITLGAKTEKVEGKMKSAMQSAGMAALFGNGYTDPNDPSVQSFNLMSAANTFMSGAGASVDTFKTCAIARAAAAVASAGTDLVTCAITAGVGCAAGLFKSFGLGALTALAIQGVIEIITPWVTNAMERDLITELAGEDLGNALASGGNMYQGTVHKANGGSLATLGKYEEFAVAQTQVIAEEARIERANLNPFDATSKNTFMGSLMAQLMSLNTTNSLMGAVTSAGTVMSSSLVALTPTTSAVATQIAETLEGMGMNMDKYEQTCPYLASIGAIGDSFCNPYMVTDLGTMDEDPADVIERVDGACRDTGGCFEDTPASDGNVKIKKDSQLMKYITYCSERMSAFGVADQNIANNFKGSTGSSAADAIIGAAPILGDFVDIFDSQQTLENIGYISGESCVAGNDLDADAYAKASPKWGEASQFQRFIEDQSLAESMGLIDKSAVAVALEEYYEENPMDDSYEGYLARQTGLTKETVTDVLEVLAYLEYVDAYDAGERYAFGGAVLETERVLDLENEWVMDGAAVALEGVVYADVRNRNFVI